MPVLLYHRDLGGAGGEPLVLLHGLLGSSRNWQSAGRELASRRQVLALDARNHGKSPHDPMMGYELMVADTLAWLDARGVDRLDLMGHSMGGKAAMRLACEHPDRVKQLVVVDIAPRDYDPGLHVPEFAAMKAVDLATLGSRAEAEALFEAWVGDWAMRKFLATNLERTERGWRWIVNLPAIEGALAELSKNPLDEGMVFEGPSLFVIGGKSDYVAPEHHALIRRHFPQARIETIVDSGHSPHVEQREAFCCLVLEALAAL